LTGNSERSRPIHAGGKITETFAEIDCRRVDGESFGANILRTAAAPLNLQTGRQYEFMLGAFEQAILERRLEILKAAPKSSVMRFANSPETSSCLKDGTSPVFDIETVGSATSSLTPGSSMASVAGKNRLPTIS
jgi:hypothetical protein